MKKQLGNKGKDTKGVGGGGGVNWEIGIDAHILGEGNGNPLQYSCLEIPWTEEPGRL